MAKIAPWKKKKLRRIKEHQQALNAKRRILNVMTANPQKIYGFSEWMTIFGQVRTADLQRINVSLFSKLRVFYDASVPHLLNSDEFNAAKDALGTVIIERLAKLDTE